MARNKTFDAIDVGLSLVIYDLVGLAWALVFLAICWVMD